MGKRSTWIQVGLVSALLALAYPAGAQITARRSSRGILVYTNGDAPNGPVAQGIRIHSHLIHYTRVSRFEPLVQRMAERHHLDPRFVEAVIRVESDWNPTAISPKGAEGLMQLTPATSRRLGARNALDPSENVRAGTAYLGHLVKRYKGNLRKALAAYYAGQGAVERAGGVPKSPAIAQYIRRVLKFYYRTGPTRQAAIAGSDAIYATADREGRQVFTNQ